MTDVGRKLEVVLEASVDASDAAARQTDEATSSIDGSAWSAVDWDELVPRLLLLAMSRLSRMTWRGRRGAATPGAAEAEDFVNEAIVKTMSGQRVWQKDKSTLFQHLAGVVVSDISHAAEAVENRLTRADDATESRSEDWPPDKADQRPDQEQEALWRSEQRRVLGHLDGIDPRLAEMAELILIEDIDGSADLAERLDCSISEVANMRKRMKRALANFLLEEEERQP